MARRFMKQKPGYLSLFVGNGDRSIQDGEILVGDKWAKFAPDFLRELEPEEPSPEPATPKLAPEPSLAPTSPKQSLKPPSDTGTTTKSPASKIAAGQKSGAVSTKKASGKKDGSKGEDSKAESGKNDSDSK